MMLSLGLLLLVVRAEQCARRIRGMAPGPFRTPKLSAVLRSAWRGMRFGSRYRASSDSLLETSWLLVAIAHRRSIEWAVSC